MEWRSAEEEGEEQQESGLIESVGHHEAEGEMQGKTIEWFTVSTPASRVGSTAEAESEESGKSMTAGGARAELGQVPSHVGEGGEHCNEGRG